MNVLKKLLLVFGILISIVVTISFRSIPKGQTLKDYNILYIDNSDKKNQNVVESVLLDNEIDDYVCLNNQRVPIMLKKNSVEEAMFKINIAKGYTEDNKYLYDRQNYFYDSTGKYQLFYISQNYSNKLNDVLKELSVKGIDAGVDTNVSYLWLIPVIIFVFALILLIFSKNKTFFLFSSILPLIYVCCNAFYASAISVILLLLFIFIFSNIYKRKGGSKKILKNYVLTSSLLISVVISFSASVISGILYLVLLTGVLLLIYLIISIEKNAYNKASFQPILIRSAKMISIYNEKTKKVIIFSIIFSILIIAYFALGKVNIINTKNNSKLMLPGMAAEKDEKLPDFEEFYRWNWNVVTYPVKSLNKSTELNENYIEYPRFVSTDGIISQETQTFIYDEDFKANVYNDIDLLDFNSIEKVIKSQGKDFIFGYTSSSSYSVSLFSIIMMFIGFTMLLFIYFSAIIRKGGRK